MQVILIRHSKTAGNELRRYIGRTDEPLSPAGVALAQSRGQDASVEKVYVTPLLRTRQTAEILFPNARQIVVEGLREMDFGTFENRSAEEMEHDDAYRAWVDGGCIAPCPDGEGREAFSRRVCAAFADVLAHERGEKAVFVVHGGTIMAVMERFARPKRGYYDYGAANCRGYTCLCSRPEGEEQPLLLTNVRTYPY